MKMRSSPHRLQNLTQNEQIRPDTAGAGACNHATGIIRLINPPGTFFVLLFPDARSVGGTVLPNIMTENQAPGCKSTVSGNFCSAFRRSLEAVCWPSWSGWSFAASRCPALPTSRPSCAPNSARTDRPNRESQPSRYFFAALEPLLNDGAPDHPNSGRIPRCSLTPIWEWVTRDLLPTMARDFNAQMQTLMGSERQKEAEAGRFRIPDQGGQISGKHAVRSRRGRDDPHQACGLYGRALDL